MANDPLPAVTPMKGKDLNVMDAIFQTPKNVQDQVVNEVWPSIQKELEKMIGTAGPHAAGGLNMVLQAIVRFLPDAHHSLLVNIYNDLHPENKAYLSEDLEKKGETQGDGEDETQGEGEEEESAGGGETDEEAHSKSNKDPDYRAPTSRRRVRGSQKPEPAGEVTAAKPNTKPPSKTKAKVGIWSQAVVKVRPKPLGATTDNITDVLSATNITEFKKSFYQTVLLAVPVTEYGVEMPFTEEHARSITNILFHELLSLENEKRIRRVVQQKVASSSVSTRAANLATQEGLPERVRVLLQQISEVDALDGRQGDDLRSLCFYQAIGKMADSYEEMVNLCQLKDNSDMRDFLESLGFWTKGKRAATNVTDYFCARLKISRTRITDKLTLAKILRQWTGEFGNGVVVLMPALAARGMQKIGTARSNEALEIWKEVCKDGLTEFKQVCRWLQHYIYVPIFNGEALEFDQLCSDKGITFFARLNLTAPYLNIPDAIQDAYDSESVEDNAVDSLDDIIKVNEEDDKLEYNDDADDGHSTTNALDDGDDEPLTEFNHQGDNDEDMASDDEDYTIGPLDRMELE